MGVVFGNVRIGVLGGIGPEATAYFYNKLILGLQEKGLIKSNKDFPQLIINSIPAPELIYEKITENNLIPYIKGLIELDNFKVNFIVMVCNTIHLYHKGLQDIINTPILDLRGELKKKLIKEKIKSVFILGTMSTIKQGLYKFNGIKTFEPNKKDLNQLTKYIFSFNKGLEKQKQIRKVKKICQKYLNDGVQTIILGCTEFAVMLDKEEMPKINTIDVLVDSTINLYKNIKSKKKIFIT